MSTQLARPSIRRWIAWVVAASMAFVAVAASPVDAAPRGGPNDPTSIEPGCYNPDNIGTIETALGVASSVDEVCFEAPRLVDREHMKFYAVDLTISGVDSSPWTEITPDYLGCGYGFGPFDPDCGHRQAEYQDVPVTLWFPGNWKHGKDKTLVQYHFSGSFSSLAGEELIGLGAIQQGMAYTAHGGLGDGASGTVIDGPFAGSEVPLVSSSMTRDVASVASDWLERYTNRAPDLRYVTGWSLGAWVITGLMSGNFFGFDMANNHVDPDDLDSDLFYDAALYIGSSGGALGATSTSPGPTATIVPSIFVEGEQEVATFSRWPYVADLIDLVGDDQAQNYVAWWSLRGQVHVVLESDPPELQELFGQDRHGPVLAAALQSLHRAVTKGKPLTSYMGGEIVPRQPADPVGDACTFLPGGPDPDRRVEWQTLDGQPTYTDPIKVYSTDDIPFGFEPCGLEIDALERIQDALDPEPAIVPPLVAHRVGPVHFNWQNPIAGEQFDVCSIYGDLDGYIEALEDTAGQLRGMGVWQPLRGSTGVRVTDVFTPPPWFPPEFLPPGPYPGIVGTFQEQGCA